MFLVFVKNSWFIILSSLGGYALASTGMSLGWLIGSLIVASILSSWRPKWSGIVNDQAGLPGYWRWIGQFILGIELGRKITASVIYTFLDNWALILITLVLSILFSLLSGLVLWRYSHTDLMTSLFGTAPGGLSSMPSIADEVGANTLVVSIVQTIRILSVLLIVPFMTHFLPLDNSMTVDSSKLKFAGEVAINGTSLLWTVVIVVGAWCGYMVGKWIKLPAPWLVGAMIGVCLIQSLLSVYFGQEPISWWPHWLINVSQILIGTSIGSRLNKQMFTGLGKVVVVGLLSSIGLIFFMFLLAWIVSITANIPLITTVLAFAPGGLAEMATISVLIHADIGFVVTVQILRILVVLITLPPIIKLASKRVLKKV